MKQSCGAIDVTLSEKVTIGDFKITVLKLEYSQFRWRRMVKSRRVFLDAENRWNYIASQGGAYFFSKLFEKGVLSNMHNDQLM